MALALCAVTATAQAVEVWQTFREERFTRGNVNLRPLQAADEADWIWIADGGPAKGEMDAVRFVCDFVRGAPGLEIDVSADERFVLFAFNGDGQRPVAVRELRPGVVQRPCRPRGEGGGGEKARAKAGRDEGRLLVHDGAPAVPLVGCGIVADLFTSLAEFFTPVNEPVINSCKTFLSVLAKLPKTAGS